jgi:hypothetical protein
MKRVRSIKSPFLSLGSCRSAIELRARKLLILCYNSDPPSLFPLSNPCQL